MKIGFKDLDRKIGDLKGSELILLASRPCMGKSTFALNIVANVVKANVPTLIFNLEMSKEQVVNRILSSEAMIDSNKLIESRFADNDLKKAEIASKVLSELPIYIDDTSGISIEEIQTKCRKLKIEKNIGLVVIDYLQLISVSNKKNESREQEVLEIIRTLKKIAKELNVPVIVISQLSNSLEKRQDKRPMFSDLKDSSKGVEQEADIVMFIYREDYYNPDTSEKNIAEIIFAKNRNGELGTERVAWLGEYNKFVDLPKN